MPIRFWSGSEEARAGACAKVGSKDSNHFTNWMHPVTWPAWYTNELANSCGAQSSGGPSDRQIQTERQRGLIPLNLNTKLAREHLVSRGRNTKSDSHENDQYQWRKDNTHPDDPEPDAPPFAKYGIGITEGEEGSVMVL